MHQLKKSLIAFLGLTALFGLIAMTSIPGQAAGGGPDPKDVSVVNTPAVKAQQSGAWAVGIVGTPSVNVANMPTVGIDPARNTVRLDPSAPLTISGGETVKVFDGIVPVDANSFAVAGPIDVSAFKQIRVVANVNGFTSYQILPRLLLSDSSVVLLDGNIVSTGTANRLYETPGETIDFFVLGGPDGHSDVHIVVFGRTN